MLCNPNNPDGGFLPRHAVVGILDALSDLDLIVVDGRALRDRLLAEQGVLIRECGNKLGSSSRFLRLAVRPEAAVVRGRGRRTAATLTSHSHLIA